MSQQADKLDAHGEIPLPSWLEPGCDAPSHRYLLSLLQLKYQEIVVSVLGWAVVNQHWLALCPFHLRIDTNVLPLAGAKRWEPVIATGWEGVATTPALELCEVLDAIPTPELMRFAQSIIDLMNSGSWQVDRAIERLPGLVGWRPPSQTRGWLERHHVHLSAAVLQRATAQAVQKTTSSRL